LTRNVASDVVEQGDDRRLFPCGGVTAEPQLALDDGHEVRRDAGVVLHRARQGRDDVVAEHLHDRGEELGRRGRLLHGGHPGRSPPFCLRQMKRRAR
jgi:hypothetical protein